MNLLHERSEYGLWNWYIRYQIDENVCIWRVEMRIIRVGRSVAIDEWRRKVAIYGIECKICDENGG
jgi:hypothetical protein